MRKEKVSGSFYIFRIYRLCLYFLISLIRKGIDRSFAFVTMSEMSVTASARRTIKSFRSCDQKRFNNTNAYSENVRLSSPTSETKRNASFSMRLVMETWIATMTSHAQTIRSGPTKKRERINRLSSRHAISCIILSQQLLSSSISFPS